MAAPVRNSVELDAVGELHLVPVVEPATLGFSLVTLALFEDDGGEVVEFKV